jgi:hypothetical protein
LTYEVIGKLQPAGVCASIFKIDHHKLLMFVDREKKRRFTTWLKTKDIAILRLSR